jgi:hypothetical protein
MTRAVCALILPNASKSTDVSTVSHLQLERVKFWLLCGVYLPQLVPICPTRFPIAGPAWNLSLEFGATWVHWPHTPVPLWQKIVVRYDVINLPPWSRNAAYPTATFFSYTMSELLINYNFWRGTRWRSWLSHSRKVAGSIPDGVTWIFHWHNPSGRTMTLESTQPLKKWVPGIFPGDKGCQCVGLTTLPPSCADCL